MAIAGALGSPPPTMTPGTWPTRNRTGAVKETTSGRQRRGCDAKSTRSVVPDVVTWGDVLAQGRQRALSAPSRRRCLSPGRLVVRGCSTAVTWPRHAQRPTGNETQSSRDKQKSACGWRRWGQNDGTRFTSGRTPNEPCCRLTSRSLENGASSPRDIRQISHGDRRGTDARPAKPARRSRPSARLAAISPRAHQRDLAEQPGTPAPPSPVDIRARAWLKAVSGGARRSPSGAGCRRRPIRGAAGRSLAPDNHERCQRPAGRQRDASCWPARAPSTASMSSATARHRSGPWVRCELVVRPRPRTPDRHER